MLLGIRGCANLEYKLKVVPSESFIASILNVMPTLAHSLAPDGDAGSLVILLIGGDKTGDKRFYSRMIPIADRLYDIYLIEINVVIPILKKNALNREGI